ncbi:MAG TPA: holdfast anchor protein HfaD [Caulobacteraceae bacterium]|nr:holdfast anchor protein HfaD [Caulobacteraceae bacterium]
MRALAKTLLVGTFLAIPMSPPFSAVATSQSVVNNNQVQLGDVFSTQTLNVVDVSGNAAGTTTATGNSAYGAVASGSLDVESNQQLSGNISSATHFNVTDDVQGQTTVLTASTGNTAEADSIEGGPLTGNLSQSVGAVSIMSENDFNAGAAQIGAISASSQAIANSVAVTLTDAESALTINQSSAASVDAESGSDTTGSADIEYSPGTVSFASSAVGNNITAAGISVNSGAGQAIDATQTVTGPLTQAAQFVAVGNAQTVLGAATASANNISITNQYGPVGVSDTQSNASFVFADSVVSAYEFGTGQASAYGVGNSVMVANVGPSTSLDNTQTNTVDTDAKASFTGSGGAVAYDATSSATAMGNAATAFACSDCGGVVNVTNNQVNSGGVNATSSLSVGGSNRSVNGVATAVGNSATFYVSKPSN